MLANKGPAAGKVQLRMLNTSARPRLGFHPRIWDGNFRLFTATWVHLEDVNVAELTFIFFHRILTTLPHIP
jgi:hypothetical protein